MKDTTMNYSPINPNFSCKVLVLPIGKIKRENKYEETKKYWRITEKHQDTSEYEYAVGVENGNSVSAYRLMSWCPTKNKKYEGRHEFEGTEFTGFVDFSWKKQIETAGPFFKNFGHYIVVEFDGKGKFRLEVPSKPAWFDCCDQHGDIQPLKLLDLHRGEQHDNSSQGYDIEVVVKKTK